MSSASGSSSLGSVRSQGSRSRSQSQSPLPAAEAPPRDAEGSADWKVRYQLLESHYKEQIPKIREAMAKMVHDLEKRYHESSQRAKVAEAKARELEQNGTTSNGAGSSDNQVALLEKICKEKDKEIECLHAQLEEQRQLRIRQDRLIKDKTTAIREYVSKKVRELEQQNAKYRSENRHLKEQVETLRLKLQALPSLAAKEIHQMSQQSHSDGECRPLSAMSEDSFCPPIPKRPSSSILATIRQEQELEQLQEEMANQMQTELSPDLDENAAGSADVGLDGDYQEIDDNHESKYEPRRFGPPQVRIERKVFPKHFQHSASLVSSTAGSEEMLDGGPLGAGSAAVECSASVRQGAPPAEPPLMMRRQHVPSELASPSATDDGGERPTSSAGSPPSPLTPLLPIVPPNSPLPHAAFSSAHASHTVSALATLPRHNKGAKVFVYTPPREYETQTIDRRLPSKKDAFERSQSERGRMRPKPPTPPLRRLPSWENRIYAIANIGLRLPEAGNLNNRVSSLPVTDELYTDQIYNKLLVPVYTTVKGRAAQIRSSPFSGESSSDSSDNEHSSDVVMAGGKENGEASSGEVSRSTSPSRQTTAGQNSVRATKRAVSSQSLASETSSDYALPPDDEVSIQTDSSDTSEPEQKLLRYTTENIRKGGFERCGYLMKLSSKVKSWRRRWFVLKNGELLYYKSHLDMSHKPQGHIILDAQTQISHNDSTFTFEISSLMKTYYLTADSPEDMEGWIKVLQNALRSQAIDKNSCHIKTKEVMKGWLIKTRNGRSRRCWCVLIGKMFTYYRSPEDKLPLGQILLRDARVEEVDRSCDSESDSDDTSLPDYTLAIWPVTNGPTYLMIPTRHEKDSWLYHLTVASGGGSGKIGTEYEQLVSKLMESDPNSAYWKHVMLLHTKDPLPAPLTTLSSESLQHQALEMFRYVHSFTNIAIESPQLDQHVSLAQTIMEMCLESPELQNELYCQLIKQTSPHPPQHRSHMQNFLLCGSSSWFLCDASPTSPTNPLDAECLDSKMNPAPYVLIQGWQLLAMGVSLFLPKQRILWYLKTYLSRNSDTSTETGKYAVFCQRTLERTVQNGGREVRPSRMEVLSILLRNPYHHSQPISMPVHFLNGLYQVVSFDGSTSVQEFVQSLNKCLGMRECSQSGFALFTDDPAGQELEHCLKPHHKVCDVISSWEKAYLSHASKKGRADTSRTVKLTYKNRLYFKSLVRSETEKERLLLTYQTNEEIINGRFPLNRDLAVELAALMAQIEFGDYRHPGESIATTLGRTTLQTDKNQDPSHLQLPHVVNKFYPSRYKDLSPQDWRLVEHIIKEKWIALHGRTSQDCVRIYLTVARGWQFFGAKLVSAKLKRGESSTMQVWLAVQEDGLSVLDYASLKPLKTYDYKHVVTFGGHRDDFMVVIHLPKQMVSASSHNKSRTCRLLFAINKHKIYEVTMLMASYINSRGQHRSHQQHLQQTVNQSHQSQSSSVPVENHSANRRDTIRTNSSGTLKLLPNKPCKPIISASIEV